MDVHSAHIRKKDLQEQKLLSALEAEENMSRERRNEWEAKTWQRIKPTEERSTTISASESYKGGVSWSKLARKKWWIVMPERRDHLPAGTKFWCCLIWFGFSAETANEVPFKQLRTYAHEGDQEPMTLFTLLTGKLTGLRDFIPPRLDVYFRDAPQSVILDFAEACMYHNATVWYTRLPTGMDLKQLMKFFASY